MKLSCSQMDVLISFYIEGDLSSNLKKQVEEHLNGCSTCRAKFDIVKSMIDDLKNCFSELNNEFSDNEFHTKVTATSQQYQAFQNNLSAYIDNELTNEESLKLKKITINNKKARKELQENYNLRKLMNNSFLKTMSESKPDYSKSVIKQLELDEETALYLHPVIKTLLIITVTVTIYAFAMLI